MDSAQSWVESWLDGRASLKDDVLELVAEAPLPLQERFQAAYQWISQKAIYSPFQDMHFGACVTLGGEEHRIKLPKEEAYSSFLLLPLLTLLTSRTLLFVGAPGRGKTSVATLMALMAGYPLQQIRRAIQHGHPQLTIADLLGSPLPSDLVKAETTAQIRVAWRRWLTMRVKIIDEYNRIPTKTQSALLSLMAEGYAEMYEQTIESGDDAWFLTANDDLGGGTFPVIEALKDRIDIVVRCTPFNARYLDKIEARIASDRSPDAAMPETLCLTEEELAEVRAEVRQLEVPPDVLRVLGFFMGQLDFCRQASRDLEHMNKDTLHLAGRKVAHVCNEDCPLDKQENLCTQTENGASTRAYQALIHYAKALAYFRGNEEVSLDDLKALAPWVLHDRIKPNTHSAFFQKAEHQVYLVDRAAWIRQMFDRALDQYSAYQEVHDTSDAMMTELQYAHGLTASQIQARCGQIQQQIELLASSHELNGPVYEDMILLKMLYSRYQRMLQEAGA